MIKTNRLSIDKDCSIRYPAKNSYHPDVTPLVAVSVSPNIDAAEIVSTVLKTAFLYSLSLVVESSKIFSKLASVPP